MTRPAHDPGCIFCKIVQGQIPSARVLETDEAVAFPPAVRPFFVSFVSLW